MPLLGKCRLFVNVKPTDSEKKKGEITTERHQNERKSWAFHYRLFRWGICFLLITKWNFCYGICYDTNLCRLKPTSLETIRLYMDIKIEEAMKQRFFPPMQSSNI